MRAPPVRYLGNMSSVSHARRDLLPTRDIVFDSICELRSSDSTKFPRCSTSRVDSLEESGIDRPGPAAVSSGMNIAVPKCRFRGNRWHESTSGRCCRSVNFLFRRGSGSLSADPWMLPRFGSFSFSFFFPRIIAHLTLRAIRCQRWR